MEDEAPNLSLDREQPIQSAAMGSSLAAAPGQ